MRLLGRVARVTARILVRALFVLAALLAILVGVIHTDWGRERIRRELEARLERIFFGHVTVEKVVGSPIGRVTLRGFALHDDAGELILGAESITIDYRLAPLFWRRFEAREVELTAPVVRLAAGRPLLRPMEPGAPWSVALRRVSAERGTFAWRPKSGETTTLTDVALAGALRTGGGETELAAMLRVRDSWAIAPRVRIGPGASSVAGTVVAMVRGEPELGDPAALVALRRDAGGAWRTWFVANREGATVSGEAAAEAPAPLSPATIHAWAKLHASGSVAGVRVDSAKVSAHLDDGVARGELAIDSARGRASGNAALRWSDGEWVVERARLRANGRLGAMLPGVRGLAGAVALRIDASGPLDALRAKGWIRGKRLRGAGVRADTARVDFSLTGLPGAWRGRIEARAAAGAHALELDARLAPRGGGVELRLGKVMIKTRDLVWRGKGGAIAVGRDGSLRADRVALASRAGRIEVGGALPARGRRARGAEQVLGLRVRGLDLAAVRAALAPGASPLAGWVDADARVTRQRRSLAIDATAHAVRLAIGAGAPPVEARGELRVGGGRLAARGWVHDPASNGAAELVIAGAAPRDPLDARAWRRLLSERGVRGLEKARLDLYEIDVATLAALAGRRPPVGARIHGHVALASGGAGLTGALKLRRVELPGVREATADLRFEWTDALSAEGFVTLGGTRFATVRGTLDAGIGEAFRGRAAFGRARIAAEAKVAAFPLGRLQRGLGIETPLGGRLTGEARVQGTVAVPVGEARLSLVDARVAGVDAGRVDVAARIDPSVATLDVQTRQRRGGELRAEARLSRGGAWAWDATLRAQRFDLVVLRSGATSRLSPLARAAGTLDADLRGRGSLAAADPLAAATVSGRVAIANGAAGVAGRRVSDLSLALRVAPGRLVLDRLSARVERGTVRARGTARLDGLAPRQVELEAATRRLAVEAGRMVVGVSGEARLRGGVTEDEWRLALDVRRATVEIPRQRRASELQRTGPLEDVIYTDPRGVAARAKQAAAAGAPPRVRVRLRSTRPIAVRGREVAADVQVDLEVVLRGGRVSYVGGAEVVRGDVELFGRRYEIQRAYVGFQGEIPPDPRLDMRLAHEFDAATVYVLLGGTIRSPVLSLRADPPAYDEAQLLGFVLGGDPDDPGLAKRPFEERAVGVASNLLAREVRTRLEETLPIDVLRLDLTDTQTGSLEIGQWITDGAFVSYRRRFGGAKRDENVHEAAVEYRLGRRWLIEVFFGDRGAGGADLLWSRRF